MGFWVLFDVHVLMSFILEFSHGPCLCHACLSLMYSGYWFSCSLCHVLIGSLSHVSRLSLVVSCHVTGIVCNK